MLLKFSKLKAKHLRLGRKGEKTACRMLKNKGYEILHRNKKLNNIEIDIIARDGDVLCFIEVKTRRYRHNNMDNTLWVGDRQAERIEKAAKKYIYKIGGQKIQYRFELVELCFSYYSLIFIKHWTHNFGRSFSA